jgi:ribosomal protein L11 methyltransferase
MISEEQKSLLIAALLELGFDSFNDEGEELKAYIHSSLYHDDILKDIDLLRDNPGIKINISELEDINWNKEWESNYHPVTIAGKCHVRAPFHPAQDNMAYEIIIEPKMAFGTAHHETTQLMASWLMELDVQGKDVLDMGCGTGLLAILANKMGARNVTGIDNDEWAYKNAMENFHNNGLDEKQVFMGDRALIKKNNFDLILANINRNVLLDDMEAYSSGLKEKGMILFSGFYTGDIEAIVARALKFGLHLAAKRSLNDWAVVLFYK